ncbi:MAG: chemotaxis protein CheB [Planctomycetaceae bacterium]
MEDRLIDLEVSSSRGFVVGVGASAGGIDALELLFRNMPPETGMSFVVVQHLSPDYESKLDEVIARCTAMNVYSVKDGMSLEPNSVYIIPPRKNIILKNYRLLLVEQENKASPNLPIDMFFSSLAEDVGKDAIAVIMSGTGSDGSRGLKDVHDAGGLIVVQDISTAEFDGMPRSAIATDMVDVIARPEEISEWLIRYVQQPNSFPRGEITLGSGLENENTTNTSTASIFRLFRHHYGIDFSLYRSSTITRRLDRRVQMTGCSNLRSYSQLLEEDQKELDRLYRDLLVEVTQFFRDPEAFDHLSQVIPSLYERAEHRGEIRVWVPGCATGEEAYSLAMLLDDCAKRMNYELDIKVFATDVHPTSLESASAGVFSHNSIMTVPIDFRERYFQRVGELYHAKRELRQLVIFAPHDITKDPPFTRIDLLIVATY